MPRRGGGGKGGGSLPREVQISKAMSWLLRHGANGEGIKMDEEGFVNVADLLSWPKVRSLSLTFPELQSIVATNSKQRFSMKPLPSTNPGPSDSDPSHHLIRANQGHSLAISSEDLLKPVLPTDPDFPPFVVHGTNDAAWNGIRKSGGLKRMSRRHVHFATGVPEAVSKAGTKVQTKAMLGSKPESIEEDKSAQEGREDVVIRVQGAEETMPSRPSSTDATKVISGIRASATTLLWVDVARSINEGGLKWWRSDNGVILTEGDAQGMVKMDWVEKVESRTGEVLWTRAEKGE